MVFSKLEVVTGAQYSGYGLINQFYTKVSQDTERFYYKGFGFRCATQDTAKPTWHSHAPDNMVIRHMSIIKCVNQIRLDTQPRNRMEGP